MIAREHRFPVSVSWEGGRLVTARVGGKAPLAVSAPPEFHGSHPEAWSPEDVFMAAAASCLAITIDALADHRKLNLNALDVRAEGVVGRRPDGRVGLTRIEQTVEVEVAAGEEDSARAVVTRAEETCFVSVSLDVPVQTSVVVRAVGSATGTAR